MAKRQKITFLDASTLDLGDVDNLSLRRLGSYQSFANTKPSEIVTHSAGADVVITNKCVLTEMHLAQLPCLKLICVAATGVNNIDLEAAKQRGIAVANVAGYSTATVAEHTLLFLLALSHRLIEHHQSSMDGAWSRSPHFALLDFPFSDLQGKSLGIIGYGTIGRAVARLAKAFGMKVLIAALPGRSYSKSPQRHTLKQVLRASDYVSLHCPLNRATLHLINKKTIRLMKRSAGLLNLSRGAVVSETDVAEALRQGKIRAYAADVLSQEPPPQHHPLLSRALRDRVLLTPHVAWASRESRQRLLNEMAKNIRDFQKGRARNRIV